VADRKFKIGSTLLASRSPTGWLYISTVDLLAHANESLMGQGTLYYELAEGPSLLYIGINSNL